MENSTAHTVDQLKSVCQNMLTRMGISGEVHSKIEYDGETGEEIIIFHIESEDAHLLIGQGGRTMSALQHILRMFFIRGEHERIRFMIDVNNYREERKGLLRQLAASSAEKVVASGESVILRPMSSYERRIIHHILGEHGGVETESTGTSTSRRVVIRLKK